MIYKMSKTRKKYRFSSTKFENSYVYVVYSNNKEPEVVYTDALYYKKEVFLHDTLITLFPMALIELSIISNLYTKIIKPNSKDVVAILFFAIIIFALIVYLIQKYIYSKKHNIKTYRIDDDAEICHCNSCGAKYYKGTIHKCWKCGNDIINENNI